MNPDDLAQILDELGRRLGPAGERVFELAIRQAYIEAVSGTIFFIVCAGLLGVASVLGYRYVQGSNGYSDRKLTAGLWIAGFAVLAAIGFVNFIAYDLPRFLNPEYAAIRDILSAVPR